MTEIPAIVPHSAAHEEPSSRLNAAYAAIASRMQGLPFVNPALRVEAVGFAPWGAHWLGVMVTPWFINLMLLPHDAAAPAPQQGAKHRHRFPAGDYEFIGAHDEAIGDYEMCSLFSPVLEFADHEGAREVARLALAALLDPATAAAQTDEPAAPSIRAPMSKRDFLRGRFARGASDDA